MVPMAFIVSGLFGLIMVENWWRACLGGEVATALWLTG